MRKWSRPAGRLQMVQAPCNAELRGEVGLRQASPRRSISTNTFRMRPPAYDASLVPARDFGVAFTIRDSGSTMKDSQHERTP